MKPFLQIFIFSVLFALKANAFIMKTGDIILQSNACYLCGLIQAEEKTPYSHMGVLILNNKNWSVLESWGNVRISTLTEFLSRRKKETRSLILRINRGLDHGDLSSSLLLKRFENKFKGLNYDPMFLWNNSDIIGEQLYCSEFVAKFMQPFLTHPILTKPMHFEVNREYWIKYFHGNPPDGAPGISPGDFERSTLFHRVGVL